MPRPKRKGPRMAVTTVSAPEGLLALARARGVNLSATFREALVEKLGIPSSEDLEREATRKAMEAEELLRAAKAQSAEERNLKAMAQAYAPRAGKHDEYHDLEWVEARKIAFGFSTRPSDELLAVLKDRSREHPEVG